MTQISKLTIGEFVKNKRDSSGIKAKHIANIANISPAYFSQIEHGSEKPTIKTIERIAIAFGYKLEDFIIEFLMQNESYKKVFLKKCRPLIKELISFF